MANKYCTYQAAIDLWTVDTPSSTIDRIVSKGLEPTEWEVFTDEISSDHHPVMVEFRLKT